MSVISEFKAFVMRGNVLDLAIAVVIGAAFGTVVKSFTDDVLMPPIGLLLGHTDFSSLYINLSGRSFASYAQAKAAGAPVIGIGAFINNVISFVIIAFAVFAMKAPGGSGSLSRRSPRHVPTALQPFPSMLPAVRNALHNFKQKQQLTRPRHARRLLVDEALPGTIYHPKKVLRETIDGFWPS